MNKNTKVSGESLSKSKVHMISLGCPKNLVDSEMMLGSLMKQGYEITDDPEKAEAIVVNTCSFIDEAKEESVQKILEAAELKETGIAEKLYVTGCLVQRYKEELIEDLPEVDAFIGSGEFQNLTRIMEDNESGKKDHFHLPTFLQADDTPRINSEPFYRAYLKISEGCLKRCSFCAIPKIRGNLQSRNLSSLVSEAKLLVAGGVREVNVISHDFTDFGWDLRRKNPEAVETPFEFLNQISKVDGLDWIRLLYLYPDGIDPKIIKLMKARENLVPYFDMPLQHINNQMLKVMNRKMTREEIVAVLDNIRQEIPNAVIRTQFIVGFPGETDEAFEELLGFIQDQRFDRVGCFTYSPQEGTPGFKMTDQIDEDVKQERFHRLMETQREISRDKHEAFVGKVVKVIIDGPSEETDLLLQGRMATQAPGIDGVVLINEGEGAVGEFAMVEILESHDYDLIGKIVG